jgi:predicted Zn-dependent protease
LELAPDFRDAYCNLADVLTKQKRYTEAEQACKSALNIDPGDAMSMINLAEVYLCTNKPAEAKKLLDSASKRPEAQQPKFSNVIMADLEKAGKMMTVTTSQAGK